METGDLLKIAAEPHLITSAGKCIELLADLNSLIKHLRLETAEAELKADLELNRMFGEDRAIEKTKALWRISDVYRDWKVKAGLLNDVRALRKNLERHAEMLSSQERFGQTYKQKAYLG
jgi:hypothetical protein